MSPLQELAAGGVDKDAIFLCGGAAGRMAALSAHTPVPAEAQRIPWNEQTHKELMDN